MWLKRRSRPADVRRHESVAGVVVHHQVQRDRHTFVYHDSPVVIRGLRRRGFRECEAPAGQDPIPPGFARHGTKVTTFDEIELPSSLAGTTPSAEDVAAAQAELERLKERTLVRYIVTGRVPDEDLDAWWVAEVTGDKRKPILDALGARLGELDRQ